MAVEMRDASALEMDEERCCAEKQRVLTFAGTARRHCVGLRTSTDCC